MMMNSRVIKFRAWDGKRMTTAGISFNSTTGELSGKVYAVNSDEVEMPVMQFTGLHDKNGVEIYEGDIVKHTMPDTPYDEGPTIVGWIEYVEVNCSFRTVNDYYGEEPIHEDIEIEVIGNIHENPELLEHNDDD